MAVELGCDWHTVNDTVVAYGTALVDDDPEPFRCRRRPSASTRCSWSGSVLRHRQEFSTQIVDVVRGQLFDVVPGRSSAGPMAWLAKQGKDVARPGALRHLGPVRSLSQGLQPHGARRRPGGRPISRREAGQHQARRVPAPGPERDARPSRPQDRSPLSMPAPPDQGRGAPGRARDGRSSWACCGPATRTATWPPCGRPRRPCASSTPTAIPTSPCSG